MSMSNFSDDELKKELERRQKKQKNSLPCRANKTDKKIVDEIFLTVKACLDDAIKDNYWDEDNNQYIFEATMKAFYGDDYFHFHNQRF